MTQHACLHTAAAAPAVKLTAMHKPHSCSLGHLLWSCAALVWAASPCAAMYIAGLTVRTGTAGVGHTDCCPGMQPPHLGSRVQGLGFRGTWSARPAAPGHQAR